MSKEDFVMSPRPRSPQSQGASRPEDDSHSGQPHHEGGGTTDDWPDDDNEYDDYDDEGDDWLEMECGLHADGQCSMAGTEHCDFSCPNRDSEDFAGSKAWLKKHGHR